MDNWKLGDSVLLVLSLIDGAENQFPQARIRAVAGSVQYTVNLTHVGDGVYHGTFTATQTGAFSVNYLVYTDSGHSILNLSYGHQTDLLRIDTFGINDLGRILGLLGENQLVDEQNFDANGQLTAARIRIFSSRTDVQAATIAGDTPIDPTPLAVYDITASYSQPLREREYRVIKRP